MKLMRHGIAAVGVLVLGPAAIVACSSSSKPASTTTTTTHAANTIRIGLEGPLTGSQKATGIGMLDGARMAAARLNARGGILGKQIEIVPIDDQADPAVADKAAEASIASGLDGVVGPYNSGAGLKTLPRYIKAGLVPIRLTSADETAGMGFTLQPMTSQIAPVATNAVSKWLGAKSAAIIFDSTQAYTKAAAAKMKELLTRSHVRITDTETIKPGAKTYASTVAKAAATKPELIYVDTYYSEGGLIAKAMYEAKTPAKCLADYGAYDNGFVAAAGLPAAQNCPVVGVPAPGDFPGSAPLVKTFASQYRNAPNVWTPYAYDSVNILADAATAAHGFKAEPLTAALNAIKNSKGWTGTVGGFDAPTGNRAPASITVDRPDAKGAFHVDARWAAATHFAY
jgi:ABC-type branched-subunit amino acid transport system substrate-binding protein